MKTHWWPLAVICSLVGLLSLWTKLIINTRIKFCIYPRCVFCLQKSHQWRSNQKMFKSPNKVRSWRALRIKIPRSFAKYSWNIPHFHSQFYFCLKNVSTAIESSWLHVICDKVYKPTNKDILCIIMMLNSQW